MNGVLVIDKPDGLMSHDVVARCRRILKTKKIGHTGTLDPFATGVMVVLVGKATRLAQFLDKDEKEYEAVVRFGFETTTGDLTGDRSVPPASAGGQGDPRAGEGESGRVGEGESGGVGEIPPIPHSPVPPLAAAPVPPLVPASVPAATVIEAALAAMTGKILQTPPMYSAKKVDGKKLYELARQGIDIERQPVEVMIRELEILDGSDLPDTDLRIRVVCSAGTYVRTLAEDLARLAGSRAHLVGLRRTRAGRFGIESAVSLEELEWISGDRRIDKTMIPMTDALGHLPEIRLNSDRAAKTRNGLATRIKLDDVADGTAVRMIGETGELLAIGSFDAINGEIKPRIVLV